MVYQDTADYDFSKVLSFREKLPHQDRSQEKALRVFELPSRIDQLMATLSILQNEIDSGTEPHKIVVLNIDSIFCEMLFDSLGAAGITVNYSEGIRVKRSPLYGLLKLIENFFKSYFDTRIFLEILGNDLFTEAFIQNPAASYLNTKRRIIDGRIFNLTSPRCFFIKNDPKLADGFSVIERIYRSKSFDDLYNHLNKLFLRFKRKKTYEFYTVKDILLSTVLELADFKPEVKESPFEIYPKLSDKQSQHWFFYLKRMKPLFRWILTLS